MIAFDDFNEDNDPHREHDFGSFELEGEKLFWKIDYYDLAGDFGSEDPTDPRRRCAFLPSCSPRSTELLPCPVLTPRGFFFSLLPTRLRDG